MKQLALLLLLSTTLCANWTNNDDFHIQVENSCIQVYAESSSGSINQGADIVLSLTPNFSNPKIASAESRFTSNTYYNRICGVPPNTKLYVNLRSNKGYFTCPNNAVGDFLKPTDLQKLPSNAVCESGNPPYVITPDVTSPAIQEPDPPIQTFDYMEPLFLDRDRHQRYKVTCQNNIAVDFVQQITNATNNLRSNPDTWHFVEGPPGCYTNDTMGIRWPLVNDNWNGTGGIVVTTDLPPNERPHIFSTLDPTYKPKLFKMRLPSSTAIGKNANFSQAWYQFTWQSGRISRLWFMNLDIEVAEPASVFEEANVVSVVSNSTLRVDNIPQSWHREMYVKVQCHDSGQWTGRHLITAINQSTNQLTFNTNGGSSCILGKVMSYPTGWEIEQISNTGLITLKTPHDYLDWPYVNIQSVTSASSNQTRVTTTSNSSLIQNGESIHFVNTGTNLDGKAFEVKQKSNNTFIVDNSLNVTSSSGQVGYKDTFCIDFTGNEEVNGCYIGDKLTDTSIQIISPYSGHVVNRGFGSYYPEEINSIFNFQKGSNNEIAFIQNYITPPSFPLNGGFRLFGFGQSGSIAYYGNYVTPYEHWTAINPLSKNVQFNISNSGAMLFRFTLTKDEVHIVKNNTEGAHGITVGGDDKSPANWQSEDFFVNYNLFVFPQAWVGSKDGRARGHRHEFEVKGEAKLELRQNIFIGGVQDQAGTQGPVIALKEIGGPSINDAHEQGHFNISDNIFFDVPEGISILQDTSTMISTIPGPIRITDNFFFLNYMNRIQSPINQSGGPGFHGSLLELWGSYSNVRFDNNAMVAQTSRDLSIGRILSFGQGYNTKFSFRRNVLLHHGGNYPIGEEGNSVYGNRICENGSTDLWNCQVLAIDNQLNMVVDNDSGFEDNIIIPGCFSPEHDPSSYESCITSSQVSKSQVQSYYQNTGQNIIPDSSSSESALDTIYESGTYIKRPQYQDYGIHDLEKNTSVVKVDLVKVANDVVQFKYESPSDHNGTIPSCQLDIATDLVFSNVHTRLVDDSSTGIRTLEYTTSDPTQLEFWRLECGRFTNIGVIKF